VDVATERLHLRARDGTALTLRPVVKEDKDALIRGFERLSLESRFKRFLTGMPRLPEGLAAYLTDIDHVNHFAWVTFADDDPDHLGIGVSRYIRLRDDAEVAESAVAVIDAYQRRGIGSLLMLALVDVAWSNGIRRFRASYLADNAGVRHMINASGAYSRSVEPGVVAAEVDIEPFVGRLRT